MAYAEEVEAVCWMLEVPRIGELAKEIVSLALSEAAAASSASREVLLVFCCVVSEVPAAGKSSPSGVVAAGSGRTDERGRR